MISYKKVRNVDAPAAYLADTIEVRLHERQKILWLLAGGSGMDIAVKTAIALKEAPDLANLTISLSDERFGLVGHRDSNWQLLFEKGFLLPGARMLPVLCGKNLNSTVSDYATLLEKEIAEADFSVAMTGMGPDGHIFGIKPGSPALSSKDAVVGYAWDDFVRITPTLNIIQKLDEVVIYAGGAEKHDQIDKLGQELAAAEQPALLLKKLKKVTFFNDYKGEKI